MTTHTNIQIAADWALWREYFDTGATMTRDEFAALTQAERVVMLVEAFGTDRAASRSVHIVRAFAAAGIDIPRGAVSYFTKAPGYAGATDRAVVFELAGKVQCVEVPVTIKQVEELKAAKVSVGSFGWQFGWVGKDGYQPDEAH